MLEARTAFGGDGGGETLEERSERGTAPRNAVGRPIGGFPTAAGKQSRNRAGGGPRRDSTRRGEGRKWRRGIIMMLKCTHVTENANIHIN